MTNSIGEIFHKLIMRFELVVLGLKVFNRSVRLIFTTLMCEITILPFRRLLRFKLLIIYSDVLNACITLL